MNIVQLNSYITLNGGSETVMANLTEMFEQQGHSVLNIGYTAKKEARFMGNYLTLGPEKQNLVTFFTEKKTVDLIVNKINELEAGLVVCHNVYHKYPITELLKAIRERTRATLALIFHDYKAVCPRCNLYNGSRICTDCKDKHFVNVIRHRCRYGSLLQSTVLAIDSYYNNRVHDAYAYPHLFISPSHFLAKKFHELGFKYPIAVIHNPFDMETIRDRKSSYQRKKTIIYAGRFSVDKGIALYLDFARRNPDIHCLIAGNGDVEADVRKADAELPNLEYLGVLNKKALFQAMDRADYLVLPSIWYENNPNIIIEAMAFGLPVVGSNLGGIPELIGEGRGHIFNPLLSQHLDETIRQAYSQPEAADIAIAEKAQAFARSLSFDGYYRQLCQLLPILETEKTLLPNA